MGGVEGGKRRKEGGGCSAQGGLTASHVRGCWGSKLKPACPVLAPTALIQGGSLQVGFERRGYRADSATLTTELITRLGILVWPLLTGQSLQTRLLERLGMTVTTTTVGARAIRGDTYGPCCRDLRSAIAGAAIPSLHARENENEKTARAKLSRRGQVGDTLSVYSIPLAANKEGQDGLGGCATLPEICLRHPHPLSGNISASTSPSPVTIATFPSSPFLSSLSLLPTIHLLILQTPPTAQAERLLGTRRSCWTSTEPSILLSA